MKIETHNILVDKSKLKKDGVYSYKEYLYAVKNNNFYAYINCWNEIYQVFGVFHTKIGKVEGYDRRKNLLKFLNIN